MISFSDTCRSSSFMDLRNRRKIPDDMENSMEMNRI